jgi:hypothetical protein
MPQPYVTTESAPDRDRPRVAVTDVHEVSVTGDLEPVGARGVGRTVSPFVGVPSTNDTPLVFPTPATYRVPWLVT